MSAAFSPRSDADEEDSERNPELEKLVNDGLKDVEKSAMVDVDKKMLEGRRATRGFTMSVGSRSAAEVDIAALRGDKRAFTMPAMGTRRGDYTLSAESQQKLMEAQAALAARFRRGSVGVAFTIVPDEELVRCWEETAVFHVHGAMTEGQAHWDERVWECYPPNAKPPGDLAPIVACQKGSKGFRDTTPNQDNFSLTYFKNGYTFACAFDGHGPFGHIVSTRTVQTAAYYLATSEHFDGNIEQALIDSFEFAHRDVVAHALRDGWDVQASGSTAVAALWKNNKVWTANAGDSRCVIGSEVDKRMIFETVDHKPNTESEKRRIEENGGEVRSQTYPDGWVSHRIFVKDEDYPGLCMARTLGDSSVKAHGVISTPEVVETTVDLAKKPFLILASDGVWEFIDSPFAAQAVAKKIASDGPNKTLQKLQREAKKRWKQEEGDYCDDITSILVQLR